MTTRQPKTTARRGQTFRCAAWWCACNQRTGTPCNFLEYLTVIVLVVVLWRLRCRLSLHDLADLFLKRGPVFTYEAIREWEQRCQPLFTERLRSQRRGKADRSWYVDET